jgi:hypothetical protein
VEKDNPLKPRDERSESRGCLTRGIRSAHPAAWGVIVCYFALALTSPPTFAQDKKKPDKKAEPRVLVVVPLGAAPGKTKKLTIRGIGLDKATDVKVEHGTAKLVSKGAAPVPDKNPDKVGDTQVVAEVTLDEKLPDGTVALTVVLPDGETKPHKVLIESTLPVVAEKEPNEGFKQSQEIKLPVVVEGMVERPRDVDVFRFAGKRGQKVTAEVLAHRYGSPLDAMLTLYNAAGQQVAFNDDLAPDTRDARLEVVLPADGDYFLVLIDAHDAGSPAHAYRLVVK